MLNTSLLQSELTDTFKKRQFANIR